MPEPEDFEEDLVGGLSVSCPYCGEEVEVTLDLSGGAVQEYVEDCQVCCQPWVVCLRIHGDGTPEITVATLDEG